MIKILNADWNLCTPKKDFDLVFVDPPFNIGQKYRDFIDEWNSKQAYDEFISQSITRCKQACRGVLALHGNDYLCELYLEIAKKLNLNRIAWINWHYDFGQCTRSNWIDARCHCLFFSIFEDYTWNPEDVLIESARVRYGDKRIYDTENGGQRLPGTIWSFSRIQGNNKERRPGHPNQLPELYLTRIIKAYTNSNDWILDPFGGSGTTAVVAQALLRNCVIIDISKQNCDSILTRCQEGAVRDIIPNLL